MNTVKDVLALLTPDEIEQVKLGGRVKNGLSRDKLVELVQARSPKTGSAIVRRAYEFLRGTGTYGDGSAGLADSPVEDEPEEVREWENDEEKGTAKLNIKTTQPIKTLDDLIRVAQIDTEAWEVVKWSAKSWTTTIKNKKVVKVAGDKTEVVTEPLVIQNYGVSADLRKRVFENALESLVNQLREDMRTEIDWEPLAPAVLKGARSPYMALLAMPDAHFGKQSILMEDWTLARASEAYESVTGELLVRGAEWDLDTVITLGGHDGAHIDSPKGLTTKGTQVEYYSNWHRICRALVRAGKTQIAMALNVAERVEHLVIPGNHDEFTSFSIGMAMEEFYDTHNSVAVDNTHDLRKYRAWGQVLLGFTHGKYEKKNELPLIMAKEVPELWGSTSVHEWHTGHLHHRSAIPHGTYREEQGVMVRVSPSISPADGFHVRHGYIGALRGAELFVYHKEKGIVAQYFFNPEITETPLPHRPDFLADVPDRRMS